MNGNGITFRNRANLMKVNRMRQLDKLANRENQIPNKKTEKKNWKSSIKTVFKPNIILGRIEMTAQAELSHSIDGTYYVQHFKKTCSLKWLLFCGTPH